MMDRSHAEVTKRALRRGPRALFTLALGFALSGCMFFVSLSDLERGAVDGGADADGDRALDDADGDRDGDGDADGDRDADRDGDGDADSDGDADGGVTGDADAGVDGDGGHATDPVIVTHDQAGTNAVAVDGNLLYYTNRITKQVRVVAADAVDGSGTMLIQSDLPPYSITTNSSGLFVTNEVGTPNVTDSCVRRYDKDGTKPLSLGIWCSPKKVIRAGNFLFLLYADSSTYYTIGDIDIGLGSTLRRIYTIGFEAMPFGLAFDGAWYYSRFGNILRVQEGESPSTFLAGQAATELIADGTNLYWVTTAGDVKKAPTGSADPQAQVLASGFVGPQPMAQDAQALYLASSGIDPSLGRIVRISKSNGQVTELATHQANPKGLAVTASSVYWANEDDGTIMRVAKP